MRKQLTLEQDRELFKKQCRTFMEQNNVIVCPVDNISCLNDKDEDKNDTILQKVYLYTWIIIAVLLLAVRFEYGICWVGGSYLFSQYGKREEISK